MAALGRVASESGGGRGADSSSTDPAGDLGESSAPMEVGLDGSLHGGADDDIPEQVVDWEGISRGESDASHGGATENDGSSFDTSALEAALGPTEKLGVCPTSGCGDVIIVDISGGGNNHGDGLGEQGAGGGAGGGGHLDRDENGQSLSTEAKQHRDRFRVRCRACDKTYCVLCKRAPYHLGRTCNAMQQREDRMQAGGEAACRYCEGDLPGAEPGAALRAGAEAMGSL